MGYLARLADWKFVVGKWKGGVKEYQVDEGNIITSAEFDFFPSDKFIRGIFESNNEEGLINRVEYFLYEDPYSNKYLRKAIFSYGFVNNEVSYYFDNQIIKFEMVVEPNPPQFKDLTWRSYIQKISEMQIELGLEHSKDGTEFTLFNKSILSKSH